MAGVEAIGLALGILPLLLSAIEHYDDILRPFSRYRRFTSKAQRFIDELEIERTIFRTECQLLLAMATNPNVAAEMLQNHHHPSWDDDDVRDRLFEQLGVLGKACVTMISKIESKLCDIGKKSEQLGSVIVQENPGNTTQDKHWRSRVATKLKFSFSEPSLRQLIKDLRILNKTFLTLSNQAARLDCHYDGIPRQKDSAIDMYAVNHEMEKFQKVQRASQLLYDALSRACNIHPEHVVQLCLLAKCTSDKQGVCKTRFTLAFSRKGSSNQASLATDPTRSKQPTPPCDVIWFEIESVTGKNCETRKDWYTKDEEKSSLHKLSLGPKREKSVGTSSTDPTTSSDILPRVPSVKSGSKIHQNLCMHLSQISVKPEGSYAYTLEQVRGCEHFVHGPVNLNTSQPSISLAQIINQSFGETTSSELPQYQRLSHAKALTLAVLQFHATPWLSESWKSDNVFFREVFKEAPQQRQVDAVLHLNATVAAVKSMTGSHAPKTTSSEPAASVIPNLLLFDLGIMLLELAYHAPFQALRQRGALPEPVNTVAADFTTALRLADEVGVFLGAGFAAIVKKCLRCDFGCGNNLDHQTLQARIYEDVVCKLNRLEEGFRKLQLDD